MTGELQNDPRVCIVGTGYVGLTLAAALGQVGFSIVGVERNADVVRQLRAGTTHFHEAGLESVIRNLIGSGRLRVDTDYSAASECSVFIISVGTPIDDTGKINLSALTEATNSIARVMPAGALVILRSTVKVGVTSGLVQSLLEASGKPFDLAFCPERTLEGQALKELRRLPQIVGGTSATAVTRAAVLFTRMTTTVVHVSSVEVAEVIKLVDNTSRDISFAVANEVARFCDQLGVDAVEVIRQGALGYARTSLPMPGPVGGPCLSKDPYIFVQSVETAEAAPRLAATAREVNRGIPRHAAEAAHAWMTQRGGRTSGLRVALLGMAFKGRPETDDMRGTTTLDVRDELATVFEDASFVAWDPVVRPEAISAIGIGAADEIADAFDGTDLVVIANNHAIWSSIDLAPLTDRMRRPGLVYDLWSNFDRANLSLPEGVTYISLGRHASPIEGGSR